MQSDYPQKFFDLKGFADIVGKSLIQVFFTHTVQCVCSYHDHGADPTITDKELHECKMNIMVTALFELFFTPVNEERLRADLMQWYILSDPINLTIEDFSARDRLDHPEGTYYRKKQNVKQLFERGD